MKFAPGPGGVPPQDGRGGGGEGGAAGLAAGADGGERAPECPAGDGSCPPVLLGMPSGLSPNRGKKPVCPVQT